MDKLDQVVNLIIGGTILAVIVAVAWYVLSKIRNSRPERNASPEELLGRFGEFYADGSLTPEEYRAIKRTFAESLKATDFKKDESADPEAQRRSEQLERLLRSERR